MPTSEITIFGPLPQPGGTGPVYSAMRDGTPLGLRFTSREAALAAAQM